MGRTKGEVISLLEEYLDLIEDNKVHYCDEKELGFNVKCYSYSDHDKVIEKYKEKYKDDEEKLLEIEELQADIEGNNPYNLFYFYQESAWSYAKEVFIEGCTTYPKDYFIKAWEENKCKSFPYCMNKKTAIKWDKEQDKQRRAFNKVSKLYTEGRSGGYMIVEYDFYMTKYDLEWALEGLQDGSVTLKDFLSDYSIRDIKEDMEDIKRVAEEVEDLKKGHELGWADEVEFRLQETLGEFE